MTTSTPRCPHCGKPLSSPEKLAWHLTRECPALVEITTAEAKTTGKSAPAQQR